MSRARLPELSRSSLLPQFCIWLVVGLLSLAFATPSNCIERSAQGEIIQEELDIGNYVFEHEKKGISHWSLPGVRAFSNALAYLIVEPRADGKTRRALILIDDLKNPKRAYFLGGHKLEPVPELEGKSLSDRIDWELTFRARSLDLTSGATVSFAQNSRETATIKFRLVPALSVFYEKFKSAPCLTLPDVVEFTREEHSVAFVTLLQRGKHDFDLDPKCGRFGVETARPIFSYIHAPTAHFVFTSQRFVFHYHNYVVSVPFDLTDQKVSSARFLITKDRLTSILVDFNDFVLESNVRVGVDGEPSAIVEPSPGQSDRVQRLIDLLLLAQIDAKGEGR